ncbi:unnamed protein product, partial [Iphiclides podalirius]
MASPARDECALRRVGPRTSDPWGGRGVGVGDAGVGVDDVSAGGVGVGNVGVGCCSAAIYEAPGDPPLGPHAAAVSAATGHIVTSRHSVTDIVKIYIERVAIKEH